MTALSDAIYQNTRGDSAGYPLGVPTSYSWYSGGGGGGSPPPSNFTSVTGWGQVYPEVGQPVTSGATVQIANFKTYVHLTNGSWVLVQNEATQGIGGAHYLADFSGNSSTPWQETKLPDGSVSVDAPQSGYNDHFWPGTRGTYAAGTVDGVFVEADMKTNDPNAHLVANVGADWWLSQNAGFVSGFNNNPGAGMSQWVQLSTTYKTLYFSSLTAAQLQADPPPGLSTTTSGGTGTTTPTGGTSSGGTGVTTPTGGTGSTGGSGTTTTPAQAPTLTVADHSLSVSPWHSISLGLGLTVPNSKDSVTVNISGLPWYETITDNLDHKTFRGSSIDLTAAQVKSGLTLTSHYRGWGDPVATLKVTAKDSLGSSISPQTITVTDPPATASSGTTTSSGTSASSSASGTSSGHSHGQWWHDHHPATASTASVTSAKSSAPASSETSTATSDTSPIRSLASNTSIAHWLADHPGFAEQKTTLSEFGSSKLNALADLATKATSSAPSAGAKAYALLNQMMAGDFGDASHFAHTSTTASALSQQEATLTKPLH